MPYFRDQVVQELTSLYEFLVTMYLPADALKYAPMPGGWPEISAERLPFMERADAVIDLMKHIPYIRQDWDDSIGDPYQVHEESVCNDFSGEYFQRVSSQYQYDCDWQLPGDVKTPPHLLILWRPKAPTRGWVVSLNTKTGELKSDLVIWGKQRVFADIEEFCEFVKGKFRTLEFVPMHPQDVTLDFGDPVPLVKDVYTSCGWPSSNFRKAECASRVAIVLDEAEFSSLRTKIVQEITTVYELLVRMYLPSEALCFPPPEGWPNINKESMSSLGKTPQVIELMRRLPYIREGHESPMYQVSPGLVCNDYAGDYSQGSGKRSVPHDQFEPRGEHKPPSDVLTLWRSRDLNEGTFLFIRLGTGEDVWSENHKTGQKQVYLHYRHFAETIKKDFLQLRAVPLTAFDVKSNKAPEASEGKVGDIQRLYQKHGWPLSEFEKQNCMYDIEAVLKDS